MTVKDYTHSFDVDVEPTKVFAAMTQVQAWWGRGIKGKSEELGDSFIYKHKDFHVSRQTVSEFNDDKRLVWTVSDSKINFVKNILEWENTKIIFEVARRGSRTTVTLTHVGLVPKLACYDGCSGGWDQYFGQSLKALIETGEGNPDPENFSQ